MVAGEGLREDAERDREERQDEERLQERRKPAQTIHAGILQGWKAELGFGDVLGLSVGGYRVPGDRQRRSSRAYARDLGGEPAHAGIVGCSASTRTTRPADLIVAEH